MKGTVLILLAVFTFASGGQYRVTNRTQLLSSLDGESFHHLRLDSGHVEAYSNRRHMIISPENFTVNSVKDISMSEAITGGDHSAKFGTIQVSYHSKSIQALSPDGSVKNLVQFPAGDRASPYDAAFGNAEEIAFTDMGRDRIYLYNMVDGRVKILAEGNDTIQPRSIAYDAGANTYYVTVSHGIYSTADKKIVAGIADEFDGELKDGTLNESRFYYPIDILVIRTGLLAVTDYVNNRIRIVDINANTVTSLCDCANCIVSSPVSLAIDRELSTLYVGGDDGVFAFEVEGFKVNLCYGVSKSGVYEINIEGRKMQVWCDLDTPDGPWITFLNRFNGSLSFDQDYEYYDDGFGDPAGEYWLGLRNLHALTKNHQAKLRIDLEQFQPAGSQNKTAYALYDKFWIGDYNSGFALEEIDGYSGTAGDMETMDSTLKLGGPHKGQKFSTKDKDRDQKGNGNCAADFNGGWWFKECYTACLTCGPYRQPTRPHPFSDQMVYFPFTQRKVGLKSASMKVKLPISLA